MMPSRCFYFPVSLLLLFLFIISCTHSFHDDRQSLLAFKSLITRNPNQSMADWSSAVPLCNWTAVTCIHRRPFDRVIALNLTAMDLQGTISPSLANLSFLHSLDLSMNALHGHIPPQLGRLFRLRSLSLRYNQLEGSIPVEFGSLKHLQFLYLGANRLTGTIPSFIANLSDLIDLGMSRNSLSGAIPPQLGLLPSLETLKIKGNELSGIIPVSLSNISTLAWLDISANKLFGTIPRELGLLTNLQRLLICENELSGSIPTSLSNISSLTRLDISTNKLTGTIPQELGLLNNLQTLALYMNELVGIIPASLSNIFNLNRLYLWKNQLSGNIPNSIGNCSKLTILAIGDNKLSGSVPVELGNLSLLERLDLQSNQLDSGSTTNMPFLVSLINCSHLQELDLSNNKLSGVLPPTISLLSTNLSYLLLSSNAIEGNIPPHIGNLSSLIFLKLNRNLLNGTIPPLGNLENIQELDLGNNRLEGNIPDDIKQLKHLGLLDISRNMLSGKIPNSLHHLEQLWILSLHHNYFSGKIPTSLGDCKNLGLLDLSHNRLSGSIPPEVTTLPSLFFYLNFSWNLLDGHLPLEIEKLGNALAIDISANLLTGVIPPTLGNCIALESLNLSNNSLEGSIPDSLGYLRNLMELDLSSNSLSGTIPVILNKLTEILYLNLSFNNLKGEISKGEFSTNQTIIISLIGNPDLCGPQVFSLPACPAPRSHFDVLRKVVLPIVGAIGFILCCLLLGFLSRGNLHIQNFDFPRVISHKSEHQSISYQELYRATNGFSEANLLGKGNFGSVYKGILSDGMLVAVKVFNLQNDQVVKSFKTECNILKNVRHRNLVRIITSCSNLHFKGLVFKFMDNGSLEEHLYPDKDDKNVEDVCDLGLKTRLDIAIDVAHAMEYLHHDSLVHVVHCDIKPSNVLLDANMFGLVTDFGIAKLIGATSNDSHTSTLALKGSVGYIAPEYGLGERFSTQGDVYSYGILLLEMLTRKRPTSDMFEKDLNLHKWVNLAFPNRVKEVIDSRLLREMDGDEIEENDAYKCLLSFLHVGLLCSKDSPEERPTMRDVSTLLESFRKDLVENHVSSRRWKESISPTYGRTDMKGALCEGGTVESVTPLAATVEDAMLVYAAMSGSSPTDLTRLRPMPPCYPKLGTTDNLNVLGSIKLGKYANWFNDVYSDEISETCERMLSLLTRSFGIETREIVLPELEEMRVAHIVSIGSEALSHVYSSFNQGRRMEMSYDVRVNMALFESFSAANYVSAQSLRRRIMHYHMEAFKLVDIIVTPTTGMTAPKIPPSSLKIGETDLQTSGYLMRFVIAPNLIGLPAISVPVGYDKDGLPIGLQLIGQPWAEATLLRLASAIEELAQSQKRPAVFYDVFEGKSKF